MSRTTTTERKQRTANTRFASCGITCLYSSSVFQLGFSDMLTVLCSENPHERQAKTISATPNNLVIVQYLSQYFKCAGRQLFVFKLKYKFEYIAVL